MPLSGIAPGALIMHGTITVYTIPGTPRKAHSRIVKIIDSETINIRSHTTILNNVNFIY